MGPETFKLPDTGKKRTKINHLGKNWASQTITKRFGEPSNLRINIAHVPDYISEVPKPTEGVEADVKTHQTERWEDEFYYLAPYEKDKKKEPIRVPDEQQLSEDLGFSQFTRIDRGLGHEHNVYLTPNNTILKLDLMPVDETEVRERKYINNLYHELFPHHFAKMTESFRKPFKHPEDGDKVHFYSGIETEYIPPLSEQTPLQQGKEIKFKPFADVIKVCQEAGIPYLADYKDPTNYGFKLNENMLYRVVLDGLWSPSDPSFADIGTLLRLNLFLETHRWEIPGQDEKIPKEKRLMDGYSRKTKDAVWKCVDGLLDLHFERTGDKINIQEDVSLAA